MGISSSTRANLSFVVAIVLLGVSGAGAFLTIVKLHSSEELVNHTYAIEVALGDFEDSLGSVGRARLAYLNTGTQASLDEVNAALKHVPVTLAQVRQLTSDNPAQQGLCDSLESNASHRTALSQESVRLQQQRQDDPKKQQQLTFDTARAAIETSTIIGQMRANEDRLLEQQTSFRKYSLKRSRAF